MKKLKIFAMILWFAMLLSTINLAHGQRFSSLDQIPHDIVYFKSAKHAKPEVKVIYGRPTSDQETIFGKEIPFGKIWRTGANEATEIKFYKDVMFGNKFVKKGVYTLYTIPGKDYWTIILNEETNAIGSFFYDEKKDVARIEVPAHCETPMNIFSIAFDSKRYGTQMVLAWGVTRVKVPLYLEESLLSEV